MTDRPIYDAGFPMPDMAVDPEASLSARAGSPLPEGTTPACLERAMRVVHGEGQLASERLEAGS